MMLVLATLVFEIHDFLQRGQVRLESKSGMRGNLIVLLDRQSTRSFYARSPECAWI